MLIVTNKGAEAYSGRFDGKEYEFPVDAPVTVPETVAAFLFGYGRNDAYRHTILVRNGWERNGMPNDPFGPVQAMKRLQSFVFKAAPESKKADAPPQVSLKREMTGVNAISPNAKDDGKTILPRSNTLHVPSFADSKGKRAPLAPPAA